MFEWIFTSILGLFSDVFFLGSILAGLVISAAGYAGGIYLRLKSPWVAVLLPPLVVALGASLFSGAISYRQAINGAEVKAQLDKKDREIARQAAVAQIQAKQREVAEQAYLKARNRAEKAAQAAQANEDTINALRKDIAAGRSTSAPADPAYSRRLLEIKARRANSGGAQPSANRSRNQAPVPKPKAIR